MTSGSDRPSVWERLSGFVRQIFDLRSRMTRQIPRTRQREVVGELDAAAVISQDYLMLTVLSCVIATFGLILDSGAVIIGAMLIAPLMMPILAIALALIRGDPLRIVGALITLAAGVAVAIGMSMLLGRAVSTSELNFLAELPAEVTSRTAPTLFDLTIAFAGGLAASYALAQPRLSPTLPGVAISTALMPPLCVVGIGIAQGRADVRDGALLLFLANFVAIVFSSAVVFALVGFGPLNVKRRREVMSRTFLLATLMLILVAVPLVSFMVGIASDARENQTIRATLVEGLEEMSPGASLVSFDRQTDGDALHIVATVRSPQDLSFSESLDLQRDLAANLDRTVALELLIIPITKLEPLSPPTETPPPAAGTETPPPIPTPTATTQATTTATIPATATATSSPTPTVSPTATRAPTATPSATPPPTPTPVMYASVAATNGEGVNVRRDPRLDSPRITALREGVVVQLTGRSAEADGFVWIEVVIPSGQVGWIAEPFLVPYQPFESPELSS